ncbi:Hydroxyacylglutathione hydrolase [Phytophthora cinnamomi]|uniref:Hydroxyacylglutathione hydrolase n=1 Tax=Phytophthora cinnamomi TaxID=4785 RepID=UPI0035595EB9|nr:Hydroxyacylglutathione hydrolase [Phytophthora cinnamomi]
MLQRYERIRPQIKTVDAAEELVPTGLSHHKLLELLKHMKKFNSVTKTLECGGIGLADAHLLFDSVNADYPCMRDQLKPTTKIVHSPVLESAVVKAISGGALSSAEQAATKRFEVPKCGIQAERTRRRLRDPNSAYGTKQAHQSGKAL